jgi:cytochrome P450
MSAAIRISIPLILPLAFVYLLGYLLYRYIIYPTFFSPLSKIPKAHWTVGISSAWISWKRRTNYESRTIYAAHQAKGPLVRLAPAEVSVNSLEGLKKIYTGGFDRTDWLLRFRVFGGTPNLGTMLGGKEHSMQRRMLTNVFSKSYILNSPDFHALSRIIISQRLYPLLDAAVRKSEAVDVFDIGTALGVEFMSAYEFGIGRCYDFLADDMVGERRRHSQDGITRVRELPGHEEATKRLENEFAEMVEKTEAFLASDLRDREARAESGKETTYPVVYAQMRDAMLQKGTEVSHQDVVRRVTCELFDDLEAGRTGIGIVLTYAIHYLSQRPGMQTSLRTELAALEPPLKLPFNKETVSVALLRKLDSLELLDAIVMETLRLNPSAPGPLRRGVPKEGTVIEGYFIPGGTTVFSTAYCMHHQEAPYPDPFAWKPERWMKSLKPDVADSNAELEKGRAEDDPRRWFWAFGSGGKMCIGNHYATIGKLCFFKQQVQGLLSTLVIETDEVSSAQAAHRYSLHELLDVHRR